MVLFKTKYENKYYSDQNTDKDDIKKQKIPNITTVKSKYCKMLKWVNEVFNSYHLTSGSWTKWSSIDEKDDVGGNVGWWTGRD